MSQIQQLLNQNVVCRSLVLLCAIAGFAAANYADAAVTSLSWQPSPADLNDLDHHMVYTWRIDNISVNPATIPAPRSVSTTSPTGTRTRTFCICICSTPRSSAGVASFVDDPTNSSPVTDFTDDFISTRFHSDSHWLVANGTADTFLKDKSFTNNPVDYTYTFTASQLAALQQYLAHGGDIALGFDPDCHYFNDGVTFTLNFTPVPEVANMIPIALLLATSVALEIRRRRRSIS